MKPVHVAVILSCIIKATELRKESGMDACTSSLCSWNHSTKEVPKYYTYIAVAKNILFRSNRYFWGHLSFTVKIAANDVWLNSVDSLAKNP